MKTLKSVLKIIYENLDENFFITSQDKIMKSWFAEKFSKILNIEKDEVEKILKELEHDENL